MQEYEEECVVGSQSDFNFPCVPLWLSVLSEENHRGTQRNTEGYKGIDRCIESQGNHENVNKACHKAPNSAHRHERSTCTSMEEECVVGSQCDFNFPCGPLWLSVLSEENHRGTQRNTEGYKGIDRCIESQGNHENVNKACHKAPNSSHRHERSTCTSMEEEMRCRLSMRLQFPLWPSVVIGFERGEPQRHTEEHGGIQGNRSVHRVAR